MYGGTQSEMQRLIKDAAALDSSIDANSLSFDNIVKAIHAVQDEMGITGTTALEAGRTISGSVGAMKSAWSNLVTGLADDNADIGKLVDNLVTTIVGDGTENNLGVLGNVMPAVKTALSGASRLVSELLPKIVQEIPSIINDNLPILAEAAISIIQSLVDGISQNQEMLMETAFETITFLAESLITMLPQIVQLGLDLIVSLANGIAESLPELIPTIVDVILQIVETLTSPDTLNSLIGAALAIMLGLAEGLIKAIPDIVAAIPTIIENLIQALVEAIPEIITAILDGLASLGGELADLFSEAWEGIKDVFSGVGDWFSEKFTEGKEKANEAWSNAKELFAKNWENVKAGYAAVGDWFSKTFEEGKERANEAWSNAKELFSQNWENVKAGYGDVGNWFSEKFTEAKNNASAAWDNAKSIFSTVWENIKSGFNISDALTWGKDMIQNFIDGITAKWKALKDKVSSVAQTVKDFLGFSEPKEGPLSNFHTYAPDMMDLFAKGIHDNENVITDQIEKSFDFGERTIKFGAEYGDGLGVAKSSGMAYGGTSIGNITINIDGAKYDDEQSLAEAVSEALQSMTDRRSAVYA